MCGGEYVIPNYEQLYQLLFGLTPLLGQAACGRLSHSQIM